MTDLVPWQPPTLVDRLRRRMPELKFRPKPPPIVRRVGRAAGAAIKREARAQLRDMFDVVDDRREEKRRERIHVRYRDDLMQGDPGTPRMQYVERLYVVQTGGVMRSVGIWVVAILMILFALALFADFDPEPASAPIVQPLRFEDI